MNIKRSHRDEHSDTYFPVSSAANHLAVEVGLRELKFAGNRSNEKIQIGFTSDRDRPKVAANLVLSRNSSGDILIQGDAPGQGTVIPPTVISRNNELDRPIVLRLEIDATNGTYRMLSRNADDSDFQRHGAGKIAPSRPAKYLRLSAEGNLTDNEEVVKIESLKVNWRSGKTRRK